MPFEILTEEDREKNKAYAKANILRLSNVESWLLSQGIEFRDKSGWTTDPWSLRTFAENLIEAIDKGKL
jgi:hypothetical protein